MNSNPINGGQAQPNSPANYSKILAWTGSSIGGIFAIVNGFGGFAVGIVGAAGYLVGAVLGLLVEIVIRRLKASS
jgi:hypothetical protein